MNGKLAYWTLSGLLAVSMSLAGYAWGTIQYVERIAVLETDNQAIKARLDEMNRKLDALLHRSVR